MQEICLVPTVTVCGLGILLNAILLAFLFAEKRQNGFKIVLISVACSDIALSLVLIARTVIPIYLKEHASTSFAALIFGIYCNMINMLLMAIERAITIICNKNDRCCCCESGILTVAVLAWIVCIPMAIALGVLDHYDGIGSIIQTKVIPLSFAAVSIISVSLHLILCCQMHVKLKRDTIGRSLRSLGHGLILSSRRGLELRQEFQSVGLSFGLTASYIVFTFPFMLYLFLNLESVKHCQGPQHNLFNILVSSFGFKTVASPLICICITVFIPTFWKQIKRQETESST